MVGWTASALSARVFLEMVVYDAWVFNKSAAAPSFYFHIVYVYMLFV